MPLSKKTIKWKPATNAQKILQIYIKGVEYAFVSSDYRQCHDFVWCKDFLHDVIFSCVNNRAFEIYKFRYNPKKDPNLCLDKLRLLVANSKDKSFKNNIKNCIDFLNQVEKRLGIKKTIFFECKDPPRGYETGVFLLQGSKRWIYSPPMISLYSLLIRIGLLHDLNDRYLTTLEKIKIGALKPYQKFDKKWLLEAQGAMEKIFSIGDRKIFSKDIRKNYPKEMLMDTVHNRLGIMGFANEIISRTHNSTVLVPHWHNF